jgi:YfiH family protein
MEQVHSCGVAVVGATQAGAGLAARETAVRGADALVTADGSVVVVGLSADCPLVALWDETAPQCAVVHAGWRGLASGVIAAAVSRLAALGARAESLRAVIGAAIGECCYEVDADVAAQVLVATNGMAEGKRVAGNTRTLTRPFGPPSPSKGEGSGMTSADSKVRLDLVGAALDQLASCGVAPSRVSPLGLCTRCHAEGFHSYRRDAAAAGRQAMAIRLTGAAG